jgi:hypothetical protein
MDKIMIDGTVIECKILQVTSSAIIFISEGKKRGIPMNRVTEFKYGRIRL